MDIKRFFFCLTLGILSACGASSLSKASGSLSLAVEFPNQSFQTQVLPSQTHSVFVMVYGATNPLSRPLLPPPLKRENPRILMPNIPIGAQTVLVAAMDCQGNILTASKARVDVKPAPAISSVTLDLSTDPRGTMNPDEYTALDRLQPDCPQPTPSPTPISQPTPTDRPSEKPLPTPRPTPIQSSPSPVVSVSPLPLPLPSPSGTPVIVRISQENPFKMKINQEGTGLTLEMSYTGAPEIAALIDHVDFYINGAKVTTANSAPFHYYWETDKRGEGQYTLQAVAYDADGNEIARSNPATILLLIQYQTSSGGSNNGPNPRACTPGIDLDGNIDLCEEGGAGFSAEVTVVDGNPVIPAITVDSP